MSIFKRFKDGFFNPGEVNNYVSDKKIITVIFFILLVILLSIPHIVYISATPLLSYEDKNEIRESFYHSEKIPFRIMSGVLFNKNSDNEYVYTKDIGYDLHIVIKANMDNSIYLKDITVIELSRTGVFLYNYGFKRLLFSYSEYEEIFNLDFGAAYENDSGFWNKVFMIAEKELKSIETEIKITDIAVTILSSSFSLFILSLIFTIFNKSSNRRRLSFSKMWQMVIYFLSPYVLVSIISETFNVPLIRYIGIFISIINIMRFNQGIIFRGEGNEL